MKLSQSNPPAANATLANEVMQATGAKLGYLKARWADEKQYENFAEYSRVIELAVAGIAGVTFLKMTKSPWGFRWLGSDGYERSTQLRRGYVETVRIGGAPPADRIF